MAADEEYLDNLLKSLEGNTQEQEEADFASLLSPFNVENTEKEADSDKNEKESINTEAETAGEETAEVREAAEAEGKEEITEEAADWKADLDELLAAADAQEPETEKEEKNPIADLDVTQFIDGMENVDDNLSEINDLLKKSDNNEAVDDDMLALLESIKDDNGNSSSENNNDVFDIFADFGQDTEEQDEHQEEAEPEIKEKKKKRGFPWKKKKTPETEENQTEAESNEQEAAASEENIIFPEGAELKEKPEKKEKEPGFFGRLFQLLTQEEEEEKVSDENSENAVKPETEEAEKEKKEKKKKKFKIGKKNKQENSEGEEEENLEEKPEKKKKPKREKKKKEKAEKTEEAKKGKKNKILNNKTIIVITAFCATLIAAVVLLSITLPDYADKKNAREAFYQGNYKEAYLLLYDKNLNAGDAVIFGRVSTVLKLEKKWDSYEYYKKSNQDAEALDALLRGVLTYEELENGNVFGAEEELRQIYDKIVSCLSEEYHISAEEAAEINGYDDDTYTQKVYSVVYGTEFVKPGEEKEEPKVPQDILPEEEDIIRMEPENEGV